MKKFILFFFILLFSTSVLSDNIYIFGNIGISDFQIDNDDKTDINTKLTNLGFSSASTSVNSDNFSYELGLGVVLPLLRLGLEASIIDYGEIKFNSTTTSPAETINANVPIKGVALDILKELGPISLNTGLISINDNVEIVSSKGNINVPIDDILIPKVGVNYNFGNYRLEYTKIFLTTQSTMDIFMLGYKFSFL